MPGTARIGCSSWTSDAWWGKVYPEGLKDGDRLAWYAKLWDTVEIDSTYYRDPGPSLFRRWASSTPEPFVFALKFPRDLLDPKRPVDREKVAGFLAHAALLGPKLGPTLLQFPPWVRPGRAEQFLGEVLEALSPDRRYAVELREAGWFVGQPWEKLQRTLADRAIALAWSYLTYVEIPPSLTSDLVYLRFIGDHTTVPAEVHGEVRVDRRPVVARWAERFRKALDDNVQEGFAFFNNHFAGFAPQSVNDLRVALGLDPIAFQPPPAPSRGRVARLD